MGKGTPENKERNDALMADYQAKVPMPELEAKYGLTATAIHAIRKRRGIPPLYRVRKLVKAKKAKK
jgi:hypothetical protein